MPYKKLTKFDIKGLQAGVDKYKLAAEAPLEDMIKMDLSGSGCLLCEKYFSAGRGYTCRGCPVRVDTGEYGCNSTPYFDEDDDGIGYKLGRMRELAKSVSHGDLAEAHKRLREHCLKEAKYLQSLLDNNPGRTSK